MVAYGPQFTPVMYCTMPVRRIAQVTFASMRIAI
jgi:hypothetical protein